MQLQDRELDLETIATVLASTVRKSILVDIQVISSPRSILRRRVVWRQRRLYIHGLLHTHVICIQPKRAERGFKPPSADGGSFVSAIVSGYQLVNRTRIRRTIRAKYSAVLSSDGIAY